MMNTVASCAGAIISSTCGVWRSSLGTLRHNVSRLHKSCAGSEVAMTMLMMAAVGIPLIIVLIAFSTDIVDMLWDATQKLKPLE